MNIGLITCSGASLLFLLFALLFALLKEKAALLVSGFNTIPKEQRMLYDHEAISRDHKNMFLLWALILGIGALLSWLLTPYMAIPAGIIWLVVFCKDVHLDEKKAFDKYLL